MGKLNFKYFHIYFHELKEIINYFHFLAFPADDESYNFYALSAVICSSGGSSESLERDKLWWILLRFHANSGTFSTPFHYLLRCESRKGISYFKKFKNSLTLSLHELKPQFKWLSSFVLKISSSFLFSKDEWLCVCVYMQAALKIEGS